MSKTPYGIAFLLGLVVMLGSALVLRRLGLPLLSGVSEVQAAGLATERPAMPNSGAAYSMDWYTIDGGGGVSSGGSYQLSGGLGQPDAGTSTGGSFTLVGGFWPGALQPWPSYIPLIRR